MGAYWGVGSAWDVWVGFGDCFLDGWSHVVEVLEFVGLGWVGCYYCC